MNIYGSCDTVTGIAAVRKFYRGYDVINVFDDVMLRSYTEYIKILEWILKGRTRNDFFETNLGSRQYD